LNIRDFHSVYFVGIGGIGMSAIARWFFEAGFQVGGYDKTASDITLELEKMGIDICYSDAVENIPDIYKNNIEKTLVVYTPAIPANHKGLIYFNTNGLKVLKRSEILGLIVKDKKGIGIAGTHGKTSISSTVAWLMHENCNAFLGGISKNINSNVIINAKSDNVVIEADEFDRSFLTLHPEIAVISAMDADHLDIYTNHDSLVNSFQQYVNQIKPGGKLIAKKGLAIEKNKNTEINYYTYALKDASSDFYASNIKIVNGFYEFTWHAFEKSYQGFKLGVPGLYNLENAVVALASAWLSGIQIESLKQNLESYQGVKRRFDYQIRSEKIIYIDDYAHHPEEIKACINSVRDLYPDTKILGIFQPHLYSRTRDFSDGFAESLSLFDAIILTDIYPARELPMEGVNSSLIFDKIKNANKLLCAYNNVVNEVLLQDATIIITMGAGDIDRLVHPIKKGLIEKYNLIHVI